MEINCEFLECQWHAIKGNVDLYTCKVTSVEITDRFHTIKQFKGVHALGRSNEDIEAIWFVDSIVEYFPRDLQEHFPNLKHLNISRCGLKEISRFNLKGLEGLLGIWIQNCQLTTLPDNLFRKMSNLKSVKFANNKIEFASSKFLEPLIGRDNVSVSLLGNRKINSEFKQNDPYSLTSLGELLKMIDQKCKKPTMPNRRFLIDDPEDFNPKMKELWTSGRFSDFNIIAGAKLFKVHKNILGIQSSVFAKVFEDHIEATELKIHDFSHNAVEALLHFVYTSEFQEDENAMEKFAIAEKFQIAKMILAYEEVLSGQLDDANALDIFLFAHRHSSEALKHEAFAMIARMFPDDLPDDIKENPVQLKRLLDNRREYEKLLRK